MKFGKALSWFSKLSNAIECQTYYRVGNALVDQGDLVGAIDAYNTALGLKNDFPKAHNNLGVALQREGRLDNAVDSYRNAIKHNPNFPEAHNNLGNALKDLGKLSTAIDSYKTAIALKPNYAEAHNNLGTTYQEQGNINEAITSYNKSLKLKPKQPLIYNNIGLSLQAQGDFSAAINSYKAAIVLQQDFPEAHRNCGLALQQQGNIVAAITSYKTAIKFQPNDPGAHINLGIALQKEGELEAAISSYSKALQLNPLHPKAHNNLGIALQEQGKLTEAIKSFNTAIELNPDYPEAYNNLSIALKEQGNSTAAIEYFNKALQLNPDNPETHYNLGNTFVQDGRPDEAIVSYKTALKLNPNYLAVHWNCSHALLLSGNYKDGWVKYEWRSRTEKPSLPHANPICPRLDNDTLSDINKLLVVSEQGFGDTLQFMRYALTLKQRGIRTSLCAQPKLHSLIRASGIDASPLTPERANQVTDGKWIPLLSLPKYLEVSPDNPIITEPYIQTTDELNTKWRTILSAEQRPIIGINWQGSPSHEVTTSKGRSLPLETFAPIATQDNATLLSLQKGFGSEQLDTCSFKERFVSCQDQVNDTWDFLETAAILANCDLIITSDTAVAHLAGGMGKATWLLLKKIPEWRWGLEGDSTFWYPTMRLFRQNENGDWNEVMQQVTLALQEHFGSNTIHA
ncbi:hypothetical protein KR52_01010 [Synechococcus sp. KORDI-52]|uniref:tetratricopeptide repeat protein n=1 Tax=Synechococcus sp. KORDI-52 TaxID=585425 RepID=UPI0004E06BBC|nr:tetratricopeptide repeat protein [Synechococcus sp. KORDI-52]AII47747.1 hypothetical protein KR52_01010 [Synechococcus sp. KORDI-52]